MQKKRDISHFKILDWNFHKEDSRIFIHNFCWYPSRFIPIIPAYLIQALSKPYDTVLDPFCGSGTTIVEALKLKRNAIGIDLSPIGCFIADTKVKILMGGTRDISRLVTIRDDLNRLYQQDFMSGHLFNKFNVKDIPNYEINKQWYHLKTLEMLAYLYKQVEIIPNGFSKNIAKLFFISILMSSAGYKENKSYAYYADNVKPKGELCFKNAFKIYHHKIDNFIREYKSERYDVTDIYYKIFNDDAKRVDKLVNNKVDLVITSPPYLSVTDYTTGFRLAYLWYNFFPSQKDLDQSKVKEIGARWKRKHRTSYEEYMSDMRGVCKKVSGVLKKGGYMCIVLGEPKKYIDSVRQSLVDYITHELPFSFIESFVRNINKRFFIHPEGAGVQQEDILIFQKGAD